MTDLAIRLRRGAAALRELYPSEFPIEAQMLDDAAAIIAKLPKTADDVPVVPGMDLWKLDTDGTVYQFIVTQVRCDGVLAGTFHGYSDGPHDVATCYFTRPTAAAEKEKP